MMPARLAAVAKRRFFVALAIAIVAFSAAVSPVHAKHAAAPTAPGHYTDWGPDIDDIVIARTFRLGDYERVVVEPFATDGVALPPSDENTYEPVKTALGHFTETFIEGLRGQLSQSIERASAQSTAARALQLRGKVVLLDPGSRAKRYWGGFGAGAVRVEIRCEVVDAASGEVLLTFGQQRRSGFGGFGGDYEALMNRTIRQIAEDAAHLLKQF